VQGGTIDIEVGPNDSSVQVSAAGQADTSSFPVPPGKQVSIPVPAVPPGTVLAISVGKGLTRRVIYVEVVATSP
jgi:hypothetical protein